jgi:Tol biopolymer transport system component
MSVRPARIAPALAAAALLVAACAGTTAPSAPASAHASVAVESAAPTTTPAPIATVGASPPVVVADGEAWYVYQGGTGGPPRMRLVRPDGTGDHVPIETVPGAAPGGGQQHPDWSHDGTRIAFAVEMADGAQDLWIVNADGSGARRLFDCQAPCGWSDDPSWSPDDRTIAFVSADHDGDVDSLAYVETIDVETGDHRRVRQAPPLAWCYVPRWAPDGHRLVVECDTFKTARFDDEDVTAATIGIVDTTAAKPAFEPLLPWSSFALYPDWHPTEDRVVFQVPTSLDRPLDEADIAVMDIDDGKPTVLTSFGPGGGWGIQPTWTPDGMSIVFVGEDIVRSHPAIATIAADGTGLERLVDDVRRTHPRLRPTP